VAIDGLGLRRRFFSRLFHVRYIGKTSCIADSEPFIISDICSV
jgi:hypothetical protein